MARSRGASIRLLPEAIAEAEEFLQQHQETRQRLEHVSRLIDGFETPYGVELLATVHWLAQGSAEAANDVHAAVDGVKAWSKRKQLTFRPEHIEVAWSRLRQENWI